MIKEDRFQVFLCASPAHVPFNFAVHPWLVVNRKGKVSRWELTWEKGASAHSWGHLQRDFLPPFQGIGVLPFFHNWSWKGRIIGTTEGGEGSLAHQMADFIERSPETYPHSGKYSLFGPNSNTYAEWVLKKFPDFPAKLPWNAFGKNRA